MEWDSALNRLAVGDPRRVRQVLLNLIGNALKFTARGGTIVRVQPAEVGSGPGLKFNVIDTGPGISADQQERLFQKFVQVDASYTRQAGGTGLGLAISKRLVELMGGRVGITSREGEGSTFWFTLPLSSQTACQPPAELPAAAPEVQAAWALPGLQVLVVDDNPINVQLAVSFLEKLGCFSSVAEDGFAAVTRVKQEKFDLVLMDCQMPGKDGFQATKDIRAWETAAACKERLPIIAVTANALEARTRSFESGMNSFISKPYKLSDLKAAIETVVSGRLPPALPDPAPEAAAGAAPGSAMDLSRAMLLVDNNPGLLALLAGAFMAQGESVLAAIRLAIRNRDSAALREHAHKLKGSVAIFAAEGVQAAAYALEKHASPPDWPAIDQLGMRLEAEMSRLMPEIVELELAPAGPLA